ncbi:hypothetical protein EB001_16285 [bacterium]|jgi:hypothetical protein|nr:hypothetical protein [bacterium]
MTIVTLGQASKLTGLSKTTLVRQIKSGKFSAVRNEDGSYSVQIAELSRVHKVTPVTPVTVSDTGSVERLATPQLLPHEETDTALQVRVAVAEQSLKHLQEMLDMVKEQRDQIVKDRDHWQQQATQNQQLLLSYQGRTGIFKRLFG